MNKINLNKNLINQLKETSVVAKVDKAFSTETLDFVTKVSNSSVEVVLDFLKTRAKSIRIQDSGE